MKYFKEAKYLWKKYVPKSGQATTVQGELMRAVEKLREEAQRNGNINWDSGHVMLSDFLEQVLTREDSPLPESSKKEITQNLSRIKNYRTPYTEDDLYDDIVDSVVEWSNHHKNPIPHPPNPDLKR